MSSEGQDRADALGLRGVGLTPTDLRTFARNRTLPQEATDVSIYDKGPRVLNVSGPVAPRLFKILHPNFYEKALFVKVDVATALGLTQPLSALRAMLLSALVMSQLSFVTRCIG